MLRFQDKKAVLSMTFKWIFVLIVGSLFLLFFIQFAFKTIPISTAKTAIKLTHTLDDSLNALSISTNSFTELPLGLNSDIIFSCDSFYQKGFQNLKVNHKKIIFANELTGNKIQVWLQQFDFPFRITPLYYLSNDKNIYYLISDSSSLSFVNPFYNAFPKKFKVINKQLNLLNLDQEKKSISSLQPIFILFTDKITKSQILQKIPNAKIINIDINKKEINLNSKKTFYLNDQMLYGAIFSSQNYDCVKDKLLEKFSIFTDMYSKKIDYLMIKSTNLCKYRYIEMQTTLKDLKSSIEDKSQQSITLNLEKLEQQNKALTQNDCQNLY